MKIATVDEYIASTPKEYQARLKELRALIKSTVPQAEESMSYHMPYYKYKGHLVYFCLWKNHIGLYAFTTPVLERYKDEVGTYVTEKGTVQVPLNEDLPIDLIKKLLTAQMEENSKKK